MSGHAFTLMRDILQFRPIYKERVWGGRALETVLGRPIPPGVPVGESWDVADRPDAQSVVIGGSREGMTLRAVLERDGAGVMGPGWLPSTPFPILVKWLDCHERLSLQVHPPADAARRLKGEPKTENWYVADTAQGAQLMVGLKKGATRAQFERAVAENTLEHYVHQFSVAVGDSILVPSGRIHAIDAGNLILEIQQNSDTTYRVYDWGRMGLDGRPRKLAIAESLESMLWDDFEPELVRAAPTSGVIAKCDGFLIRRVVLDPGERLQIAAGEQPRLLSVVSGSVTASPVRRGDAKGGSEERVLGRGTNLLVPYAGEFRFLADAPAILLVTEDFAGPGVARA
jgi:mannose-6-phosphate isomerase